MVNPEVFPLSLVLKAFISCVKSVLPARMDACAAHACLVLMEVKEVTGYPKTAMMLGKAPVGAGN